MACLRSLGILNGDFSAMLEPFVYLLCACILVSAFLAIGLKNTLPAMISGGLAGLFAAVCYVILGAPDVAMTEASIGSGLSVLIFLYAIRKTSGSEE